jgi:hypothetical protein
MLCWPLQEPYFYFFFAGFFSREKSSGYQLSQFDKVLLETKIDSKS